METLKPTEKAARFCEHVAKHDEAHGYSQPKRYGAGWSELVDLGDGKPVKIHDFYDCSELVIDSYESQGIDCGGATFTLDMFKLVDSGNFQSIPVENRKRGDILNSTRNRHAAMYLGGGWIAEAHHGDYAGGLDGDFGDQDGTEIRITAYYEDCWTACYRCIVKNGWIFENDTWRYYDNGIPCINHWEEWQNNWYYLDEHGNLVTKTWYKIGNDWFYFDEDGIMAHSQPVYWNGGWCWCDASGKCERDTKLQVKDWHIQ